MIRWPYLLAGAALLGASASFGWWLARPAQVAQMAPQPLAAAAAVPASSPAAAELPLRSYEQLQAQPRDSTWHLSRWSLQPRVLVLEFPDLQTQGLALNRAAALLEKGAASRDRVLGDAELDRLIARGGDNTATYFLGHDYPATALARFFNLATAQGLPLNAQEQRLRALLVESGWLLPGQGGLVSGLEPAALISFSALQADDPSTKPEETIDALRRASVLRHELSHGRFFTEARYREHCQFFWHKLMNEAEREVWRHYLASQGYDARNEELMVNETQALLMNTPDERDFRAADLHWTPADLSALRERFQLGFETALRPAD